MIISMLKLFWSDIIACLPDRIEGTRDDTMCQAKSAVRDVCDKYKNNRLFDFDPCPLVYMRKGRVIVLISPKEIERAVAWGYPDNLGEEWEKIVSSGQ